MSRGKTFIITGPSGVGKSTVLKEFMQRRDNLYFSVSATTRDPRPGEEDGVHYHFLTKETIFIVILGLTAFMLSTAGGLLLGNVLYVLTKGKINPLIGSAGVSAVPMAARVSQTVGQKENPSNFLLMHAMGPNVAGVIGSAVAAGFMIKVFGG